MLFAEAHKPDRTKPDQPILVGDDEMPNFTAA